MINRVSCNDRDDVWTFNKLSNSTFIRLMLRFILNTAKCKVSKGARVSELLGSRVCLPLSYFFALKNFALKIDTNVT